MNDVTPEHKEALRAQLAQARERLDALVQDLRGLDAELEGLSTERRQFRVLHQVCSGLEELSGLGASPLFWGERTGAAEGDAHVRLVRGRVDAFEKQLTELEDRREALLQEIQQHEEGAELLEDDIYEAERQEEQRKLDWVVEREASTPPVRATVMPWARGGEEDDRFRRALGISLLLSLLLGLLLPWIDLPLPERWEPIEVPERLARLIREERPLPPPPPRAREEAKPEETEAEPTPAEKSAPKAPKETPEERMASKGILAFREKFSSLAQDEPAAQLGAQARIDRSGDAATGRPQRSMVTTQAPGSSGGINIGALRRNVGGGSGKGIQRIQVARATSSIDGIGEAERPLSDGPDLSRTDEEIQIVFDRHKAALYRLYNRELRRDPTLKGQMLLRIRIEPDGSVSLCELQSSNMKAPQLVSQVVESVRTFDFGAKDGIPPITILYPIDFLPAT